MNRRGFGGGTRAPINVGAVIALIGGLLGACAGAAAFALTFLPSSALWTGPLVCRSPHHLVYSTSPSHIAGRGQHVQFQCVSDSGTYDLSNFGVGVLQALLFALVLGVVATAVVSVLMLRRRRTGNR